MKPLKALISKNTIHRAHIAKNIERIDPSKLDVNSIKPGTFLRLRMQDEDAMPFMVISKNLAFTLGIQRNKIAINIGDDDEISYVNLENYEKNWPKNKFAEDFDIVDAYLSNIDPDKKFRTREDIINFFHDEATKRSFDI